MDMSSNSDSESELFDTQTPNYLSSLGSQEMKAPDPVWGRLYPIIAYLTPVDLNKACVLLGRAEDCDIVFSKNNFIPNCLRTISKNHLMITRGEEGQSAYISDLSKNGTFVNGTVVGNGQRIILENDDEIAIGTVRQKIYIYKTIENSKPPYLPSELKSKYEISRLLGAGACGEVRLAFEKTTFKKYAVKRIMKSNMNLRACLNSPSKIQNEVHILQSLSHPCIISTKEIVETEEAVFIILEYMEGGELTNFIESTDAGLTEYNAKLIFYQIVLGVRYLHLRGITHRDLKPGNVLMKCCETETLVKISDFGLSKIIHNNTLMSTVCGTPFFVAPEVVDPKFTVYTQQTDVWSLGVILFNMLSKELPFKSETNYQNELFRLILKGKYSMEKEIWNSVSKDAKDLIQKMLIRNPEERITVVDILDHPWIAKDMNMQRIAKKLINEDTDEELTERKRPRLDCSSA